MPSLPKGRAELRQAVSARGAELRTCTVTELREAGNRPAERVKVGRRTATIGVVVEDKPGNSVRVVVWGDLTVPFLSFIRRGALDGFYKLGDGTVAPMPDEEFWEFD